MTYEQIIQKTGKEIELSVTYEYNGESITIDHDNIKRAKISFNCGLVGSVMSGIELETYQAIPDVPITLTITARFDEDEATKVYSNYHLKEMPTYNADSKSYTHYLYDEMINLMKEYQPITINYPTTVLQFFQALVQELNLTTNISGLPNGNRVMSGDVYAGINYTYRDVLDDIGQATGTLFKVEDTEIQKCSLGSTTKVIDDDILKNQNISMGQHFGAINVIVLSRAGGSDNIYYPSVLPQNPIEFKISDNILMNDNNRDEYLPDLYSALSGINYDIYDCQLIGYGGFEPLDKIQIQTYEGENLKAYDSYVFNNEIVMNGGGYEESIYTDLPEQTNTEYQYADTTDKRLNETYLIVDKQNQSITAVVRATTDPTNPDSVVNQVSELSLTVEGLKSQISNVTGMTMTKDSQTASVEFTDTTGASNPVSLKVYPIGVSICNLYPNFSLYPTNQSYPGKVGLVPSGSLTPSSSLVPSTGYPAQSIKYPKALKIIFHNITANTDIPYELPEDLLYYDSEHYDEFNMVLKGRVCQVKKRCKFNADGTIGLLSEEETHNHTYELTALTEGKYQVYIQGYTSGYLSVELMAKNIYTDQFYTKVECDTEIEQSAEQVTIAANRRMENIEGDVDNCYSLINANADNIELKVGKNEVVARINATPEQITIDASKINIAGAITAINNNTTTTINGSKITTGSIDADKINISGTITAINNEQSTTINGNKITTGTIDASKINVTNLSSINSNLGNITGGSLDIGQGNFKVTGAGVVTAKSGTIGGWTLGASSLTNSSGTGTTTLSSNGRISFSASSGSYFFGVGNGSNHPVASALSTPSVNFYTGLSVSGGGTWRGSVGLYGDTYVSLLCSSTRQIAIGLANSDGTAINASGSLRYGNGDWTIRTDGYSGNGGGIYLRPAGNYSRDHQKWGLFIYGSYNNNTGYHSGWSGMVPYAINDYATGHLWFVNGIFVGKGS